MADPVWHARNGGGYVYNTAAAVENATMIFGVFASLGWTRDSVCAALGNIHAESAYNPWRWGEDNPLPSNSEWIDTRQPIPGTSPTRYYNHAYGLFQQDPAGKYIHRSYAMSLPTYAPNFSDRAGEPYDGDAQCRYLHWICSDPNGGEWLPNYSSWTKPFSTFISSVIPDVSEPVVYEYMEALVRCFFDAYERGTWSAERVSMALYWRNRLPETPPIPPTPTRKFPLIFYLKRHPF